MVSHKDIANVALLDFFRPNTDMVTTIVPVHRSRRPRFVQNLSFPLILTSIIVLDLTAGLALNNHDAALVGELWLCKMPSDSLRVGGTCEGLVAVNAADCAANVVNNFDGDFRKVDAVIRDTLTNWQDLYFAKKIFEPIFYFWFKEMGTNFLVPYTRIKPDCCSLASR